MQLSYYLVPAPGRLVQTNYRLIVLAILLILTCTGMMLGCGSGGGGSTTIQQQDVPPSGLTYSQPSISAVVNQSITEDAPKVTGTVTSYIVSPALPAGLSLSSSTGMISGTPTVATAETSYKVTASNTSGSTSAMIQISVAAPVQPPTAFAYPQAAITTFVGVSITPDIPGGSGGAISSYTVSPALPPGLSLNSSTGVISGTPTAAAASTTYVVTGSNSAGNVTASVSPTITVNAAPSVLLQLGNQYGISSLQFANSSIFSEGGGLWTLWDYTSGAILASGNGGNPGLSDPIQAQMAGTTVAIGINGGVEVLSSADGHMLSTIVSPGYGIELGTTSLLQDVSNWQLASDGSYIVYETQSGLYVYSPSGSLLLSQPGNYMNPGTSGIFAAPGQVQIANGPSGTNTVQVISVPSGASTVSAAPYQGTFAGWFTDGSHFLTTQGGVVWVYSSSGVEQSSVQLTVPSGAPGGFPSPGNLGGTGNWIWTFGFNSSSQFALNIYPIGSTTPALTDASADIAGFAVSGTTLAVLPYYQTVSIIDLSGTTPVKTDYAVPPPINHAFAQEYPVGPFAAVSSAKWVAGIDDSGAGAMSGLILDGATLSGGTPRYIGNGAALSIAGSDNNVAIATGNGQVSYFDPANVTPLGSVGLTSNKVALSTDGSVLAASSGDYSLLNIYSLPSATVGNSLTYSGQAAPGFLTDFTLSGSGTTIGQIEDYQTNNQTNDYTLQATPISGSPAIFSVTPQSPVGSILLSPDGTLAAVTTCTQGTIQCYANAAVTVYQNGQQVAAVSGIGVGWIDNGRLLVDNYGYPGTADTPQYTGSTVYSPTGTSLATPPLPALQSIQPVDSDTVYAPAKNAIYSLTTGKTTWTNPYPPDPFNANGGHWIGAVSGQYIVYEWNDLIIAVSY